MSIRQIARAGKFFLLGLLFCLGIVACNQQGSNPIVQLAPKQMLQSVVAIPDPKLPDWIEQISPMGAAEPLAQIRIRFKSPIIPLSALGSKEQEAQLRRFQLTPAIPGQFRFLTPRMVGFQADRALPKATRFQVTLQAGLQDLEKHQIQQDVSWTFNTESIQLTNLPTLADANIDPSPVDLNPEIFITANTELDPQSVQATLTPDQQNSKIPLKVELKEEKVNQHHDRFSNNPQEQFNPALRQWIYRLTPKQKLAKATQYHLELAKGIRPKTGNLPTETAFTGNILTYAPLALQGLEYIEKPDAGGAFGRFSQGAAQLKFNNTLVAEKAKQAISIDPPPKESPSLLRVYDGDRVVGLNPWALAPDTTYKITIKPELADTFGQTLEKPVTLTYKTGDVAADLWAPMGLHVFPSSQPLQLNLDVVNLPKPEYKASYRRLEPTDLVYFDSAYPQDRGQGLLPDADRWSTATIANPKPNQVTKVAIPLKEKLGSDAGLLAYGVKGRTYEYDDSNPKSSGKIWHEPTFYGLVQLTNLGLFSQWFPESGLIRVHHLNDGAAVNNAQVEIYRSQLNAKSRPTPSTCATGKTDSAGVLQLNQTQLQSCMPVGKSAFTDAPELLTIVREGKDWAFSRSQEWSGSYGYGIYAGWESDKAVSRGTIFSDRQLYQPGETAWFTGVATYLKDGKLKRDQNAVYQITLKDPKGNKTDLGSQTTNEFGTFSLQVPLQENRALGNYRIEAKSKADVNISGEFRVAEFKPPNFKVDLKLDREFAKLGETVNAQIQSNYLFGPALESAQVDYYVTREKADFTPKGWTEFQFGRQWYWPEEEPINPAWLDDASW
jgi:alpha-2-macroglobulin